MTRGSPDSLTTETTGTTGDTGATGNPGTPEPPQPPASAEPLEILEPWENREPRETPGEESSAVDGPESSSSAPPTPANRSFPGANSPGPTAASSAADAGAGSATDPWLTWLYVPGDRPETVAKALESGADVVLVDLEDAVSPDRKQYALDAVAELLAQPYPGPVPVHVRVSALDGPLAATQVHTLAPLPGLGGLRLPKVSCPREVHRMAHWAAGASRSAPEHPEGQPPPEEGAVQQGSPLPDGRPRRDRPSPPAAIPAGVGCVPPLTALLESAAGIERAHHIATAHPAVQGIALGEADLRADLGVTDDSALNWPRSRAVVAARAAGLAPPAQSVYPDIRDTEGLARSCAAGRALGFLGRTAIHPRQLPVIERAFLPTPEEVASAEEIVAAAVTDSGALALPDGRFVDAAVVAGAQRVLGLAGRRRSTGS